jgi:hypothetical protein
VRLRPRYGCQPKSAPDNADGPERITGHHGHRIAIADGDIWSSGDRDAAGPAQYAEGRTTEWKSTALRAYQRRTRQADSLIAGAYPAGTNSRRARRALAAVFDGAVGKDTASRVAKAKKPIGIRRMSARSTTSRSPGQARGPISGAALFEYFDEAPLRQLTDHW